MDKQVKALVEMTGLLRETSIDHIIKHASHADKDKVQGAILAVLKKSGTLYPGSLAKYRGKNQYIAAFMGIEPSEVDKHWKIIEIRKSFATDYPGYPETEVQLIQDYARWLGTPAGGSGCDGAFWTSVARSQGEGIDSEYKGGEAQADHPNYLGLRTAAVAKANSGEWPQLMGFMQKMFNK